MQDIMIEFYLIKINLIFSILFLIQYNCILSRRTECIKKHLTSVAKDLILARPSIIRQQPTSYYHKSQCVFIQLFEYCNIFLLL